MTSMAASPQDGSTSSTTAPAEATRRGLRLDVEAFRLSGADDRVVHFESDPDLYVGVDRALGNSRDPKVRKGARLAAQAGLVLIELGIDGYETHRVRVARTGNYPGPGEDRSLYEDAFNYPRENSDAFILGDAIDALTAIRDQLEAMRSPSEVRAAERNAFEIGKDVGRLGVVRSSDD